MKRALLFLLCVSCGPAFGQLTATIDGVSCPTLNVNQARYAQNGTFNFSSPSGGSTIYKGGMVRAFGVVPGDWFCEWAVSLPPGRYEVYGAYGPQGADIGNPLVHAPAAIGFSATPMLNNQFRSPIILLEPADGPSENDKTTTWINNGTTLGGMSSKLYGTVTIWGGTRYLGVKARTQITGHQEMWGSVAFKKVGDVPTWQKYIGGDVDIAGYFDNLKASDGIEAVILPPATVYGGPAYDLDISSFEAQASTTQTGVVWRYVQLTFADTRYTTRANRESATVEKPTFAWFIGIGRNGGLTAITARAGSSQAAVGQLKPISDWYHNGMSGATQLWSFDVQRRDAVMHQRFNRNGQMVEPKYWLDTGKLARWPFSSPEFYGSPVMQSNAVNGTGTNGVNPPAAAQNWPDQTTEGLIPSSPSSGSTLERYTVVTVPSGYNAKDTEILSQAYMMRYPLHINHLRAIVDCCRTSPPIGDAEQRFVDLLDASIRYNDGVATAKDYRAQIAIGAADTVVLEDESTSAYTSAPDGNEASSIVGNIPADPAAVTKVKGAFLPSDVPSYNWLPDQEKVVTVDLAGPMRDLGFIGSGAATGSMSTRLENNAGGWLGGFFSQSMIAAIIPWRDWLRNLCVVVMGVMFYRRVALTITERV